MDLLFGWWWIIAFATNTFVYGTLHVSSCLVVFRSDLTKAPIWKLLCQLQIRNFVKLPVTECNGERWYSGSQMQPKMVLRP